MTIIIETESLILKTSTRENFQQVFSLLSDSDVKTTYYGREVSKFRIKKAVAVIG